MLQFQNNNDQSKISAKGLYDIGLNIKLPSKKDRKQT